MILRGGARLVLLCPGRTFPEISKGVRSSSSISVSAKDRDTACSILLIIADVGCGYEQARSARATRWVVGRSAIGITTAVEISAPTRSHPSGRTNTRVPDDRQIVCGHRTVLPLDCE